MTSPQTSSVHGVAPPTKLSGITRSPTWQVPRKSGATQGRRIWMFREDGTGHVWWRVSTEHGTFGNDEDLVWEVLDGTLVVNDFPPATVEVYSDDNFLLHPIDETVEPEEGVVTRRCDLAVPEGVRGLDECKKERNPVAWSIVVVLGLVSFLAPYASPHDAHQIVVCSSNLVARRGVDLECS